MTKTTFAAHERDIKIIAPIPIYVSREELTILLAARNLVFWNKGRGGMSYVDPGEYAVYGDVSADDIEQFLVAVGLR